MPRDYAPAQVSDILPDSHDETQPLNQNLKGRARLLRVLAFK
jgi:hypothetical protein